MNKSKLGILTIISVLMFSACNPLDGESSSTSSSREPVGTFTITWKNYNESILEIDSFVAGDSMPSYDGETPVKPNSELYTYAFYGWSPVLAPVRSDATYTATFNEIPLEQKYYFGSYPQSKITDEAIIADLNTASEPLPSPSYNRDWTSYRYYYSGSPSNFMWYKDIDLNNQKYRGVYFTSYRPFATPDASPTIENPSQKGNGYETLTTYWFKYEPIHWDVLSTDEGDVSLVSSNKILDAREYYHKQESRTIDGNTVWSCNYKESDIRAWLNDDFYKTAFSDDEQNPIITSTVDNSPLSTGYSRNVYSCADTEDKLFLLSYKEATDPNNGLDNYSARIKTATDYAKALGAHTISGKSRWWLRSPTEDYANLVRHVGADGIMYAQTYTHVDRTGNGVLPAFRIEI